MNIDVLLPLCAVLLFCTEVHIGQHAKRYHKHPTAFATLTPAPIDISIYNTHYIPADHCMIRPPGHNAAEFSSASI